MSAAISIVCPRCGAAIGIYTDWLPFPYLFSLGHMLRLGASGDFKRTPVTLADFWLLGFAEYTVFAPIYWYRLYRGQREPHRAIPPDEPQATQAQTNPPSDDGCAGGKQKENPRWTPMDAESSV